MKSIKPQSCGNCGTIQTIPRQHRHQTEVQIHLQNRWCNGKLKFKFTTVNVDVAKAINGATEEFEAEAEYDIRTALHVGCYVCINVASYPIELALMDER